MDYTDYTDTFLGGSAKYLDYVNYFYHTHPYFTWKQAVSNAKPSYYQDKQANSQVFKQIQNINFKRSDPNYFDPYESSDGLVNRNYKDVSAKRGIDSLSKSAQEQIRILAINPYRPKNQELIGSLSYRAQKYPSDIDVFEKYIGKNSIKDTINAIIPAIKRIVTRINQQPNSWFLELKAGLDKRFDINIGVLDHGIFVLDYDFSEIVLGTFPESSLVTDQDYENYYKIKDALDLLKDQDYFKIKDAIGSIIRNPKNNTVYAYEIIKQIIRKYYVLRWNRNEVIRGTKQLLGSTEYITLEQALQSKTRINIEEVAYVDGRYTDMSTFIVLEYENDIGDLFTINLPQESVEDFRGFFINNLKISLEEMFYSSVNYNPFKGVKRMWSLGLFIHDKNLLERLYNIFSSDISLTNQIRSEFKLLLKVLEASNGKYSVKIFNRQLEELKFKLSESLIIDGDLLTAMVESINAITNNDHDTKIITAYLEQFIIYLTIPINIRTIRYLKSVGLYPVPLKYLPKNISLTKTTASIKKEGKKKVQFISEPKNKLNAKQTKKLRKENLKKHYKKLGLKFDEAKFEREYEPRKIIHEENPFINPHGAPPSEEVIRKFFGLPEEKKNNNRKSNRKRN